MPTGYTAELMEKGMSFRDFALRCARAFGACIMQRDDPANEPPKVRPPDNYHIKALADAQAELARLKAMPIDERIAHGIALRNKAIADAEESFERDRVQSLRLDEMANQVRAWTPPTADHKPLKDFMLQQIEVSGGSGWARDYLNKARDKSVDAYFVEAVSTAAHSVEYHTKQLGKEVERTRERNEWIEKLYESLPSDRT